MSDISQYLLKTGPIRLADLVARRPELATRLADLNDLEKQGEIELYGHTGALDKFRSALKEARVQTGGNPDAIRAFLHTSLNEIPGAGQLQVRLSESAFRRAFKT